MRANFFGMDANFCVTFWEACLGKQLSLSPTSQGEIQKAILTPRRKARKDPPWRASRTCGEHRRTVGVIYVFFPRKEVRFFIDTL